MPSINSSDAPLSVLSSSPASNAQSRSSTDSTRKPHDKAISNVVAYTNGTDVETNYPDNKIEQLRRLKNAALQPSGHAIGGNSNVNGINKMTNGVLKSGNSMGTVDATRLRSHSKTGSTHTVGSLGTVDRSHEANGSIVGSSRTSNSLDGMTRRGIPETTDRTSTSNWPLTDEPPDHKPVQLGISRTQSDLTNRTYPGSNRMTNSNLDLAHGEPSGSLAVNSRQNSVHRFSSPPAPSEALVAEAPRLVQRHTLQIPRAPSSLNRDSRDFSFSTTEDALFASGRFSPARDSAEVNIRSLRRSSLGLIRRATRSMASDAQLDEVLPDDDAARWTEIVKQKRASRRRRKEEEDDERVVVGKKVEEGHVNWVIAYNMLTGIRFTVSRTNAKMDRELTDTDFDARHKFSFDVTGNELTPSAKYDFKFKDYSPWVFRHLRTIFGLDPADYLMSLTSKYILSELGSPGKSGSFFYFSRDYKYIIKTIHHAEHKLLRRVLREYYSHVRNNPNTLISQFYGLHRVKIPYGRKIHFVVMNNLFPPHRDIHQTFDLKGSTVGRDFREDDLENNPRATLKDLNWLRRDLHLEFQESVKKAFVEQIVKDVRLLQKLHIMDYSLLVGMHDLDKGNEEKLRETTLQVFQPGGERGEDDIEPVNMLTRTPSRLENAKKVRELRQTLKKEKPTPMSLSTAKMPDEIKSSDTRQYKLFYGDGGGIRATHEDGTPGNQIYYLGVIDCLTHYGIIKRIEHFWKGLSNSRTQISPIPPEAYGERFINFITGITMTSEEADRRKTMEGDQRQSVETPNVITSSPTADTNGVTENEKSRVSPISPSPEAVDRTMHKAQKEADKSTNGRGRKESESDVPDRELKTVTIPDGDSQARNSTTLPVVQEIVEGSSDVSRSPSNEHGAGSSAPTGSSKERNAPSSWVSSQLATGERASNEEKEQFYSPDSRQEQFFSPVEYPAATRNQIQMAFKPVPQSGTSQDKPPRLGSGLIPHLGPILAEYDANNPSDHGKGL